MRVALELAIPDRRIAAQAGIHAESTAPNLPLSLSLQPLTLAQLADLAASRVPACMAGRAEPGALPPAFVAQRALDWIAEGRSEFWCASFIVVRGDGRIVGGCGFKGEPVDDRVEIAYAIPPSQRRQGSAAAAVQALLAIAFAQGVNEVVAEILPDNVASLGVVQKHGFQYTGSHVDDDGDSVGMWVARRA